MAEDVLDKVSITPAVWERWNKLCQETMVAAMKARKRPTGRIPDEIAELQSDGRLLLWVEPPGLERVEMWIEPEEWAWMDGRN